MLCKAFAAIDGLIGLGLEGELGGLSALGANRIKRNALTAAAGCLVVRSAALAAGRLVLEALLRVEFLLACGENEFAAAVLANQYFVFKHGSFTSLCILALNRLTWSLTPHSPVGGFATKLYAAHYCPSRACPTGLTSKPHHAHGGFAPLMWIASPATGIDFQPQTRFYSQLVLYHGRMRFHKRFFV